ncbi:MAG TPA: hypothetical protein VFD89_07320 [Clostridia bacterium]|nr:hypothetical protein [Clostridia bacterium]
MAKKRNRVPVMPIILLFLLVSGSLVIGFNIGGMRDVILAYIGKGTARDTSGVDSDQIPDETDREFIKAEKTKLAALRTDLENYRTQLQDRENELQEKDAALLDREREVQKLDEKLSSRFDDLIELTKIYERMDGEEAAAILSQIEDTHQVILIIKNLKKEKSAEILGLMEPKKAADILGAMYE